MIPASVRHAADVLLGEMDKVADFVAPFLATGVTSTVVDGHELRIEFTREEVLVRITRLKDSVLTNRT